MSPGRRHCLPPSILAAILLLAAASGRAVTITNVAVNPAFFSPNGDGIQDSSAVTATITPSSAWTVNVRRPDNTIVVTGTGSGTALSYTWNGKQGTQVQGDAVYTFELLAGAARATATTTLDTTLPIATITAPASGATLSNVYQNGVSDITVTGTASDANIQTWQVDIGRVLAQGTSSITSGTLTTWPTLSDNNATYTLRLQVWDKAGNYTTVSRTETVSNFKVSQDVLQLNNTVGEMVTYTSTLPFTLTETLFIKNEAGQTIRTLLNGVSHPAGTWPVTWDGKTAPPTSALLPVGGYFYIATVTDGTHSLTWDLTSQFRNDGDVHYHAVTDNTFDPFNNHPLALNYTFSQTGRIEVVFAYGNANDILTGCPPPQFCFIKDRYEETGSHSLAWPGVDLTGKYQLGVNEIMVLNLRSNFPMNAVVVYGTRPTVTAVTVTPAVYGPGVGSQTVAYTLSSYQSQALSVTLSFVNQSSMSTLRTINLGSQPTGTRTATWDGKADNQMPVAPAMYLVKVTAMDSIGNQAIGQIMTTIQY